MILLFFDFSNLGNKPLSSPVYEEPFPFHLFYSVSPVRGLRDRKYNLMVLIMNKWTRKRKPEV